MLIKAVGMPWIVVDDLQKAKQFYVDVLGFTVYEENPAYGWLEVKCGDALIGIWQAKQPADDKPGQNAVLMYIVDDIVSVKKMLEGYGTVFLGDITEMPGVFKVVTFFDPSGNKGQLFQYIS